MPALCCPQAASMTAKLEALSAHISRLDALVTTTTSAQARAAGGVQESLLCVLLMLHLLLLLCYEHRMRRRIGRWHSSQRSSCRCPSQLACMA